MGWGGTEPWIVSSPLQPLVASTGDDVPPEVWREIAAVAAEVSAYATALAGAQPRLETH